MQPMQLHWVLRLWGLRAIVFVEVVHFCHFFAFEDSAETVYKTHF